VNGAEPPETPARSTASGDPPSPVAPTGDDPRDEPTSQEPRAAAPGSGDGWGAMAPDHPPLGSPGEPPLDPAALVLLDALPVGLLHLDDRRIVTWANAAAAAIFGSRAVAPGHTVMEAFIDVRVEGLVVAAEDGVPGLLELEIRERDPRIALVRSRPDGVGGAWLVAEDLTELRRLQQIRAEFVDNVSHELRTPLSTISLLAESLGREAAADDRVSTRMRDRIGKIEVETGHLAQMVNELLDLSRIESGPPPALLDEVDLGRLAARSAERLRLFAERQGVRLEVAVPPVVPLVRGDEDRLGQVFVNLLHNAVKFSPDGGDVTVRVTAGEDEVVAAIEDHGIGIPRVAQPRIFERFYKVDRARVHGGGTGLGLSIARHIVEAHGGRIWLESEEGRGSTFAFALPTAGGAGTAPPLVPPSSIGARDDPSR
jgi:two-component system phosphate regulon sensor histidine kinase PhoR